MTLIHYATESTWKAARRGLVTGSKCPVILGLSPYQTPLGLWSLEVGIVPEEPQTPRMKLGHHLESALLGMLAEDAGIYVEPKRWALATRGDLAYSPDGLVYERHEMTAAWALAEVKARSGFGAADAWAEGVPADVNAQVQLGMDVLDVPIAYVGVLLAGAEFRWAKVERDRAWMDEHRPALLDFARRVREQDPPPPTGSEKDKAALEARYPRESGEVVALPPDFIDLASELQEIAATRKRIETRENEIKNLVRAQLGDAVEGVLPGNLGGWKWATVSRETYVVKAAEYRQLRWFKGGK